MICYECGLQIDGEPVYDLCGKALHPDKGFPHPCVAACVARIEELEQEVEELNGYITEGE